MFQNMLRGRGKVVYNFALLLVGFTEYDDDVSKKNIIHLKHFIFVGLIIHFNHCVLLFVVICGSYEQRPYGRVLY
ncbi:hypothetical protein HanRHA438_Chr08g0354191 [Helianthus annuus]|nr:hypothetical protein HanRHA438_Chr08g0354191 [Helianthus annuus]